MRLGSHPTFCSSFYFVSLSCFCVFLSTLVAESKQNARSKFNIRGMNRVVLNSVRQRLEEFNGQKRGISTKINGWEENDIRSGLNV
ncbi:unnamed protein product [Tenebrio molitor]|nr:unnamed protein product [Tenebrio molitor]